MTWKTQINDVTNKKLISNLSGIYIIAKLRHYLDASTLRSIYFTMIYPYLTCTVILYGEVIIRPDWETYIGDKKDN